ncbi:MAG: TIGR01459 family HAD-type hydrolase, partial [Sphingomonadales bacterium]|nr:TIGR01459 family HAD-type hydrolase [Sphingomonadales bacterium]
MMVKFSEKAPQALLGLREIAPDVSAIVCDLWGVLHNGVEAHSDAIEALTNFKKLGKPVVLLSNSPRPSSAVESQLKAMGVPKACYDAITTSGDLAVDVMNTEFAETRYFHLGPQRDKPTIDGIASGQVVDISDADIVLCTGLFEDDGLSLEQHDDVLAKAKARGLEMVCANPDRVVDYAERRAFCAGALVDRYAAIGGKVRWLGKPHDVAYRAVMRQIDNLTDMPYEKSQILAIGDSLVT